MNEIMINIFDDKLTVSSLQVARDFDKRHCDIIRAIEDIKAKNCVLTKMLIETSYVAGTGKKYKSYELTRDGFSLLVMGFTGRKALEWKLKYIEAFNLMEDKRRNNNGNINIEEVISKAVTIAVSETVKALMPLITTAQKPVKPLSNIKKVYKYTTPSKISMLSPELKHHVDEMIISGDFSCQQIANFITNSSETKISQMAVNRYKRMHFGFNEYEDSQLSLF